MPAFKETSSVTGAVSETSAFVILRSVSCMISTYISGVISTGASPATELSYFTAS
ncbi:MAG TPA: hypothetical protein PL195_10560 [bacterium]|nr:hypothetical protein [bacterium]